MEDWQDSETICCLQCLYSAAGFPLGSWVVMLDSKAWMSHRCSLCELCKKERQTWLGNTDDTSTACQSLHFCSFTILHSKPTKVVSEITSVHYIVHYIRCRPFCSCVWFLSEQHHSLHSFITLLQKISISNILLFWTSYSTENLGRKCITVCRELWTVFYHLPGFLSTKSSAY